jgi:hypothetical protein
VTSLNQPGGNLTGVTTLNFEIAPKRLEVLRELLPTTAIMAVLVNSLNILLSCRVSTTLDSSRARTGSGNRRCLPFLTSTLFPTNLGTG